MIRVDQITKVFDNKTILKSIDFEINRGDFLIIMGPSGSGKSTLLSIISSLARPTSGAVFYNDINISKLPEVEAGRFRNKKIGFVFQKFNLLENLTVFENILPPLVINDKRFSKEKVMDILKRFEIDKLEKVKVKKLSGGEQQRVALVRALVNDPEVLIADEPTANLDVRLKSDVISFFQEINSVGKTVIIASHDEIFLKIPKVRVLQIVDGTLVE
jgi:putative ABC transport system ATP-binding protein